MKIQSFYCCVLLIILWEEYGKEELEQILEVCLQHNIVVFADEIHADLVYAPYKHTPFAALGSRAKDITLTAIGVGKTFNMAGFAISTVAIPNKELRENLKKRMTKCILPKAHLCHM
ncbi:aminotransferase class I/II-fold pyridoxal phosphate-dependent enzyme [Sulfurimonas sp. NW9]